MTASGYPGFADPSTPDTHYDALAFLAQSLLNRAATVELVVVRKVTGGGLDTVGTVDVQPLVHQIDGNGEATAHGIISGLPYMRVQGGANAVILDPHVGDIGLAAFCARDISTVKTTKAPALPGSRRRFDWADGLYIGGFLNGAPTRYVFFDADGIKIVSPDKVTVHAPAIALEGTVTVTGDTHLAGNLLVDGLTNLGGMGGTAVKTVAGNATKANAL